MKKRAHGLGLLTLALVVLASSAYAGQTNQIRYDFAGNQLPGGIFSGAGLDAQGLVPTDLSGEMAQGGFNSGVVNAPMGFTAVVPHWQADLPTGASLTVELQTSRDGENWGPVHQIQPNSDNIPNEFFPDGRPNPNFGDTIGTMIHRPKGDGQYVRFNVTLRGERGALPGVDHLTLTFFDSSKMPAVIDDSQPKGGVPEGAIAKPPVVSRAEWGARPPNCTYSYADVTHLAVHHTAGVSEYGCSGETECAVFVRDVQNLHMDTNGWCDTGYQYLASSGGLLFEGRGGGDDVVGAHDGHNRGSMAASNMGFYHTPHNHTWTSAQIDAVCDLFSWKADQKGIDPNGMDFYSGYGADMNNIYGHRQVKSTECPGDNIFDRLNELRDCVQEQLDGGGGCEFNLLVDNPTVRQGEMLEYRYRLFHQRLEDTTTMVKMRITDENGELVLRQPVGERTFVFGEEYGMRTSFRIPDNQAPGNYFLTLWIADMEQGTVSRTLPFTVIEQ